MEYTTLGATGTSVSRLCFGCWRFGWRHGDQVETTEAEAHDLLDAARDLGINFFDTANRYGDPVGTSERFLGSWLADQDRERQVVASKVGLEMGDGPNEAGLSRKHVRWQLEETLDRLGTDYLDLYYLHRLDPVTDLAETLDVLTDLVREGKVHYLGASTSAAWELTELLWTSDAGAYAPIVVTQPPIDATLRNASRYERFDAQRYLEVCAKHDLGVVPYSPLAGGLLTGKYDREGGAPAGSRRDLEPDEFERKYVSAYVWDVVDAVEAVADELDATPAQVALRWLLEQDAFPGGMVPLTSVRTLEQLRDNVGAVELSLSADQHARIDEARGRALLPCGLK